MPLEEDASNSSTILFFTKIDIQRYPTLFKMRKSSQLKCHTTKPTVPISLQTSGAKIVNIRKICRYPREKIAN